MPERKPKRMVVISPTGGVVTTDFAQEPTLKDLQTAVGGYIEHVKCRYDGRVREAYVDEDGRSKQYPVNQTASMMCSEWGYGVIVGNICIVVPVPEIERAEA